MAVAETVPVAQEKKSVWTESTSQHYARLEAMSKDPRIQGKSFWLPNSLGAARDCLECEASFRHGTYTRMRRARTDKEWSDAGLGYKQNDTANFYQDARLRLAVRFDEQSMQFVPMTIDEWLAEKEESRARHANIAAIRNIEAWEKFVPCCDHGRHRYHATPTVEPVLYKRGTNEDIFMEVENSRTYGGKQTRKRMKKDDWLPEQATMVQNPCFDAYQIQDGHSKIVVRLFDGSKFVDAWEEDGEPFRDTFTVAKNDVICFRKPSAELYCIHMGQKFAKPGSQDEYKWEEALPNPLCEFMADAKEFVDALKRGAIVASDDLSRPVLCGVFITHERGELRIISTDTYRLLLQEIAGYEIQPLQPNVILPRAFCLFLAKAMKKATGMVKVRYGSTTEGSQEADIVEVSGEIKQNLKSVPVQFLTRTVSGQFVNWTMVLPYNARYKLQIDPASTVDVLKDLGRIAANDNNRVVFRWDEKWYLASAANDGEYIGVKQDDGTVVRYWTGEQKRERIIRPIRVDGDYLDSPADFALNFRYACDYLDWQKGDVELWINGGLNSLMFVNGNTKYVQMPMRIF